MANFGTYEGHRILSDAMNDAINQEMQKAESKAAVQKMQAEAQVAQIDADKYAREKNARQLLSQYTKNSYNIMNDPYAGLGPNATPEQIIARKNEVYNKTNLLSLDKNNVLSGDDLINADKYLSHLASEQMVDLRKKALSLTGTDKDSFMNSIDDEVTNFRITTGQDDPNITNEEFIQGDSGYTDPMQQQLKDQEFGWGEGSFKVVAQDRPEWGGGIKFKSNSTPDKNERKNLNLIIEALKTSKNNEKGDWSGDYSDTIEITHSPDGTFQIYEKDATGDDPFTVQFIDGIPHVTYKGKLKPLESMQSNEWE